MSQSTSNIWCVLKREWKGYFATPVAFVFIVIFLVLIGFFTFSSNLGQFFEREEASLASFFTWHPWIYLFRSFRGYASLVGGTPTGDHGAASHHASSTLAHHSG